MSVQAITWALEQKVKNTPSKLVLMCLAIRAGFENTCFPSIALISRETELSPRTVIRALTYLCEQNFVSRSRQSKSNGSRSANLYTLHLPNQSANVSPILSAKSRGGSANGVTYKNNDLNRHIEPKAQNDFEEERKRLAKATKRIHVCCGSAEHEAWLKAPYSVRSKALPANDGGLWVLSKMPILEEAS